MSDIEKAYVGIGASDLCSNCGTNSDHQTRCCVEVGALKEERDMALKTSKDFHDLTKSLASDVHALKSRLAERTTQVAYWQKMSEDHAKRLAEAEKELQFVKDSSQLALGLSVQYREKAEKAEAERDQARENRDDVFAQMEISLTTRAEDAEKERDALRAVAGRILAWGKARNFSADTESGKMLQDLEAVLEKSPSDHSGERDKAIIRQCNSADHMGNVTERCPKCIDTPLNSPSAAGEKGGEEKR